MDTQSSTELTQHTAQCCAPLLPAHSYTSPAEHGEPPLPPPPNTSYPQGPCLLLGEKSASRLRMCMSHVALVIHPTPHVCEKTHMCSVATRAQLSADAATKPFSSADSWRSHPPPPNPKSHPLCPRPALGLGKVARCILCAYGTCMRHPPPPRPSDAPCSHMCSVAMRA
jgi:hypothetical protein